LWGPATFGDRPTPGAQISILGTLAGDEHHQVRSAIPGLPFLPCETERPNPSYYTPAAGNFFISVSAQYQHIIRVSFYVLHRFPLTMAQRAMCLLRRSMGFMAPPAQRALSTTATTAAEGAAVAEATAKEVKRRKKKNLFDVVQFLPEWGIGYKVAKTTWRDVSYQITKINLYKVI
jgi:hypothetical protein